MKPPGGGLGLPLGLALKAAPTDSRRWVMGLAGAMGGGARGGGGRKGGGGDLTMDLMPPGGAPGPPPEAIADQTHVDSGLDDIDFSGPTQPMGGIKGVLVVLQKAPL